ncbi:Protein kinase domain-containing protein [Penicillium ucsense]|uniref:Protein kinase domain-containing protein n=1 Tax=Penicillium ucsense TaxID=2839758 RepID=A0A8J8VWK4_9EURO|nr:Protein kinase domain-containing protein [Penicillium ucsense]KAF7730764.1 Protein kinase domain-containing protein [Penicillium ucsense]
MRPLDEKRATKIQVDQVPLLQQPVHKNDADGLPTTKPKLTPGPLQPSSHLKKRSTTPSHAEPPSKVIQGPPGNLALQGTGRLDSIGTGGFVRDESPWDTFKLYYECDLAGTVAVCVRSSGSRAVRAIRQYPIQDADRIIGILRSLSHQNVVSIWECFRTSDSLYTLSKFDPLTLDHVVACKAFPEPVELAAIMSQFLDGLSYLAAQNFHHPSLNCSSVLMSLEGEIRIARIDCCVIRQGGRLQPSDFAPVSIIMMELMQNYAKEGTVGIDNPDRWEICPAAIEFVSATISASSFEELKKVCDPWV